MKKIIYLSLYLGIVAAISTVVIASTNQVTSPIIQERLEALFVAGVYASFPNHTSFSIVELTEYMPYTTQILEVFENGTLIGFVYSQEVIGFASTIQYLIGIDTSGQFVNFFVVSQNESPGFGEQLSGETWVGRIVGSNSGYAIEPLSGVTASTAPIIHALQYVHYDFSMRMSN